MLSRIWAYKAWVREWTHAVRGRRMFAMKGGKGKRIFTLDRITYIWSGVYGETG